IFNVANPQPGHWLLQVDQAIFTGGNGNDENAFGLRAHDGDATAGGTEYPVYALSYVGLGERATAATAVNREYDLYPYVTRGCSMSIRDFDADGAGDWQLDTRAGVNLSTGPATLSGNGSWNTNAFSGWTSDLDATDYGLFHFFFEGAVAGAGTNNVYTVYLGNDAAAGTPPTAQPEAETIRLYLPADGSTWSGNGTVGSGAGTINTPVQPYVGHVWAPILNAPVRIGATTRIRVTVTVTNPTSVPVQFDTVTGGTRVLTATVPTNGGPTVLVGGSAAGPGAVAEAGAGPWTITWAPGVVAAGATATLTYDIDVTPPAAGTLQLTGDPAGTLGAGTVATYLDGTCADAGGGATVCTNATQLASGTFTFGPLCQLEADVQMATPAVIADLWAQPAASGRWVSWRSAAEAGVSTFQLHRVVDGVWTPVADAVPARPLAPQGSRYSVLDPTPVGSLADSLYGLVAEDTDGSVRRHGPYRPTAEAPVEAAATLVPVRSGDPRWSSSARVELPVTTTGWQRVDEPALAAALGVSSSSLADAIERRGLRLEHRGHDIVWTQTEQQGVVGLEWFGLAPEVDDPFVGETVYVLSLGKGTELDRIEPSAASGPTLLVDGFEDRSTCAWNALVGGPAPASCASEDTHRVEIEEDRRAVVIAPLDPEGDIWFQHLLFARHPTFGRVSESLTVPMALASGEPTLTLRLQGGSKALHRVWIEADGATLGSIELADLDTSASTFVVAPDALADGALDVTVVVEDGGWVFVDGYEIEHRRRLIATEGQLVVDAEHDGPLTIEGLSAEARVIELADTHGPIEIPVRRSTSPAGPRVVFDAVAGRRYVAFDATGVRTVSPRPDPTVDLTAPPAGVDYLVIADSTLTRAAEALGALRRLDGATPWVVDVDDIHDTFTGGEADPRAVRDFLRHVVATWSQPPRWVALVGTGTYDHRDRYGLTASRAEGSIAPLLV
ncbi:MAG: C25 family cysteine peptidase, partial [Acidobacteriota bacterium]